MVDTPDMNPFLIKLFVDKHCSRLEFLIKVLIRFRFYSMNEYRGKDPKSKTTIFVKVNFSSHSCMRPDE